MSAHHLGFSTRVQSSLLIPEHREAPWEARAGPRVRREDRFHVCKDIPLTLVKSPLCLGEDKRPIVYES